MSLVLTLAARADGAPVNVTPEGPQDSRHRGQKGKPLKAEVSVKIKEEVVSYTPNGTAVGRFGLPTRRPADKFRV